MIDKTCQQLSLYALIKWLYKNKRNNKLASTITGIITTFHCFSCNRQWIHSHRLWVDIGYVGYFVHLMKFCDSLINYFNKLIDVGLSHVLLQAATIILAEPTHPTISSVGLVLSEVEPVVCIFLELAVQPVSLPSPSCPCPLAPHK